MDSSANEKQQKSIMKLENRLHSIHKSFNRHLQVGFHLHSKKKRRKTFIVLYNYGGYCILAKKQPERRNTTSCTVITTHCTVITTNCIDKKQ